MTKLEAYDLICGESWRVIREVKIDVYGRPVTANGKLPFAFEGKFYKFSKITTRFWSIHSSIIMHKLS